MSDGNGCYDSRVSRAGIPTQTAFSNYTDPTTILEEVMRYLLDSSSIMDIYHGDSGLVGSDLDVVVVVCPISS
jgi:hypothetical protein